MNTLDAAVITTPHNTDEKCAKFTIEDSGDVFKIAGVMLSDREYTFSGWVRAESECSFVICQLLSTDQETGEREYANTRTIEITTEWQYITYTFTARTNDLDILFGEGTFYIYHAQLELGNKATDWTPNPADVDQDIEDTKSYATSEAERAASAATEPLVTFTNKLGEYINFLGESAISIGAKGSQLVLELDNDDGITFKKKIPGAPEEILGHWDGTNFYSGNIVVELEKRAQFGNFAFIPRNDGSMSFLKVGG
jgi:hypothetical protein